MPDASTRASAHAHNEAKSAKLSDRALVDETILLHYLLRDDEGKAVRARSLILSGRAYAHPETIIKTVGILLEDYHVPRSLIGGVIELLLSDITVYDEPAVRLAAHLFSEGKSAFDSCLLTARSILMGYRVESFDRSVARKGA